MLSYWEYFKTHIFKTDNRCSFILIAFTNFCDFFVPITGSGVGRQRLEGSEGETYHAASLTARHSRRRGAGQPDQGNHCRRRCHSAHTQIADRKEGGHGAGSAAEGQRHPVAGLLGQPAFARLRNMRHQCLIQISAETS